MFLLKTAKVEVWRRVCQWYGPTNHHKLWSKTLLIKHIDLEDFFAKICQELARTNSAIFVSTGTPVPKSRVSSTSTSTSTWKRYSLTLGLNPSFSANPPYPAFPFSPSGFTIWISRTVYCYFWAYPSFYFLVFLFLHIFSCRFRAVD